MRVVVNRVNYAKVSVNNQEIAKIEQGLLIYLGINQNDTNEIAKKMAAKLKKLRIFEDENGKMNLSIQDVRGSYLVISQFTLYGDTKSNNRPSFTHAAKPEYAKPIYECLISELRKDFLVETGQFGAHMHVELLNDGPVNILIEMDE